MVSEICLTGEEKLTDKTDVLEPHSSQSCYQFKAGPAETVASASFVTTEMVSQRHSVGTNNDFTTDLTKWGEVDKSHLKGSIFLLLYMETL